MYTPQYKSHLLIFELSGVHPSVSCTHFHFKCLKSFSFMMCKLPTMLAFIYPICVTVYKHRLATEKLINNTTPYVQVWM